MLVRTCLAVVVEANSAPANSTPSAVNSDEDEVEAVVASETEAEAEVREGISREACSRRREMYFHLFISDP